MHRKTSPEENDNPENAFAKLMALPSGKEPAYECRMLLESMKEEYGFERKLFERTRRVEVPKSAILERDKKENFRNYGTV